MTDTKSGSDLPPDEMAESATDLAADAEIEAGEGIAREVVREWLIKLAKGDKVSPPIF